MTKAAFAEVARVLSAADIPFIVVGGIAVAEHGYGRNTYDIDLVLPLTPDVVGRAFEALGTIGYRPCVPVSAAQFADPAARHVLLEQKGMKVLTFWSDAHKETPLGIFVTEPFDFAAEYERAEQRDVAPSLAVRIVSLDTLFAMKRDAARPKDLADIDELSLPSSYDRSE
jgi:hypothetical protein